MLSGLLGSAYGLQCALAMLAQLPGAVGQQCVPFTEKEGPPPGQNPMSHNGIQWPVKCVGGKRRGRFFGIGDWGGLPNGLTMDNTWGGKKNETL